MDSPLAPQLFAPDAIERARSILAEVGSVGAYTHSKGVPAFRQHVAEFIEKRDGYPADPEHIYLTSGASSGVSSVMAVLVRNSSTGIMIPIPQYPLCAFQNSTFLLVIPFDDSYFTLQTLRPSHSKMLRLSLTILTKHKTGLLTSNRSVRALTPPAKRVWTCEPCRSPMSDASSTFY